MTIESTSYAGGSHSDFQPAKHLAYEEPQKRITMKELGLEDTGAVSEYGVTSPFSLASLDGVISMRKAVFEQKVLDNNMLPSTHAGRHCQLRGMAPATSQFVYDFWTSPETLAAVSNAAGEDLVPVFDYELGHTNIQIPADMERHEYLRTLRADPLYVTKRQASASKEVNDGTTKEAPKHVVGYHHDAYPWVCVLMLSDVEGMRGGETEIKRGDGSTIKALGPKLGCAVMMQGGFIEHCALPCEGAPERITMVTSFRPKGRIYEDTTDLSIIRSCSNNYEMYDQFVQSRLSLLTEFSERYSQILSRRRKDVEKRLGTLAGLQEPTVDLNELKEVSTIIQDMMTNMLEQLPPYHSEQSDRYTPQGGNRPRDLVHY